MGLKFDYSGNKSVLISTYVWGFLRNCVQYSTLIHTLELVRGRYSKFTKGHERVLGCMLRNFCPRTLNLVLGGWKRPRTKAVWLVNVLGDLIIPTHTHTRTHTQKHHTCFSPPRAMSNPNPRYWFIIRYPLFSAHWPIPTFSSIPQGV